MRQKDKESFDADVIIAAHELDNENDAILYIRSDKEKSAFVMKGDLAILAVGMLSQMREFPDLYDVACAAIDMYDEQGSTI